jgi:P-type E1-E2 ATPase
LAHDAATADQVRSVTGRGVEVRLAALHEAAYLGNAAWMRDTGQVLPEDLATELAQPVYAADSRICLGWNGRVQAVFLFRETLRPEAGEALARCRDLRLNVAVLTGDHAARGAAIAAELQAPVESELLPADKVAQLDAARRRYGCVAMIGDGVNDAPALAASDLGVALGCGADLSRDAAQVCLLTNDLLHVPWAIELSRQCVRIMRQNLFWAFAYNIVGVGLAATGRLNPVWSAIAMAVSSILVVSNSLRLNRDAPSTALEEVSVG